MGNLADSTMKFCQEWCTVLPIMQEGQTAQGSGAFVPYIPVCDVLSYPPEHQN